MSEPLLNVMKIMLLAGLYLFFVRVLWSVYNELRDPRTVAGRARAVANAAPAAPQPAATAVPSPAGGLISGGLAPPGLTTNLAPIAAPALVAEPLPATARLTVVAPPDQAGTMYNLGTEITIGRAPSNGIYLDDTYVSTVHARIFATSGRYFIEDLASRNGSLLNGDPLIATTALARGDRIDVGATVMEFS